MKRVLLLAAVLFASSMAMGQTKDENPKPKKLQPPRHVEVEKIDLDSSLIERKNFKMPPANDAILLPSQRSQVDFQEKIEDAIKNKKPPMEKPHNKDVLQ